MVCMLTQSALPKAVIGFKRRIGVVMSVIQLL